MAAIDSLLRILAAQNGDAMVVASGKAPVLRRGDESIPFSMPPLQHQLVVSFLEEIVDAERRAALARDGRLGFTYEREGVAFAVRAEQRGQELVLEFVAGDPARPARSPLALPPGAHPPASGSAAPAAGPPVAEGGVRPARIAPVVEGAGAPAALTRVLERAVEERASDVILSAGLAARLRVGGRLVETGGSVCAEEDILGLLGAVLTAAHRHSLDESGSVDLAWQDAAGRRYRVNLFSQDRGLAAVLRPIREDVPTLRELNLPDELLGIVGPADGLVLITGPAGSGKSTTLVALIEHVNQTQPRHVITLENPIEHLYASKRALIHQREVGRDVESFAAGLRAALRESPDIILLGEMRDHATISAALTAAETGHLVISTLHSGSAATAIDRIIDVFPAHQQPQVRSQLSSVLRAVLTQVLVPAAQPAVRLVPAYEKMIVNHAVATKIREDRCHQLATEIQTGRAEGMVSLEQSLASLVRARAVQLDVARAYAREPQVLEELVRGR
jgi:twitching motility protein PilT